MCASYIGFGDEWRVKLVPAGRELTYPLLVKILTQEKKNKSGGGREGGRKENDGGCTNGLCSNRILKSRSFAPRERLALPRSRVQSFSGQDQDEKKKKILFCSFSSSA